MGWKLEKHSEFHGVPGPVLIVVMDGVGRGKHDVGDAVWLANTPTLDALEKNALTTSLRAHGKAVGLPSDDDMGNSEVGHNALGAGRVFDQGAKRVQLAIESGELYQGATWKKLLGNVVSNQTTLHFVGLLSDGNVHSHIGHLIAMLKRADAEGVKRVRIHALLDGRDVPETSALTYVDQLENVLREINHSSERDYRVASGGGRMSITMDRYEADWAMVERGYKIHVLGEGQTFPSLRDAIKTLRNDNRGVIDQYLPGFVIGDREGKPVGPINDGDSVVFFNFRGDRAIEFSRAMTEAEFHAFDRVRFPHVDYAGMMQYDGDLLIPNQYLVDPPHIDRTMGEYLTKNGQSQFACSETQKFGHVTYFWNGNRSGRFDDRLERYVEIPSDNIAFDQKPKMKAKEIADSTIEALSSGAFRHARINFANGDMVGHTGNLGAAIVAVETVDEMVGRLLPVIRNLNGAMIVTADHGNADEMYELDKKSGTVLRDASGNPYSKTSHTLNDVPCHIVLPDNSGLTLSALPTRGLANVASTALHLMGYAEPDGYERSLLANA
ncbi:MAG: 2,3-bisphosphoglycerate-independent phosphoglycerate mutase [Polyangiales bacterium]